MDNPFNQLLNKIEIKVRSHQEEKPDDFLITVAVQLKLFKVLYRSMLEYDMRNHMHIISDQDYENHTYKSTKAILDYFQFINLLNQFGRILIKCSISIPRYNRIAFFRNKVAEHWEEYTKYGITGSLYQSLGEAAIPSTSTTYVPEDRKKIKLEIDEILKDHGLILDIENSEISNIADQNREKIYSVLEKIDPNLTTKKDGQYLIPDKLIGLLFKFGFPAPVGNITAYSEELVAMLEKELQSKLVVV